MAKSPVPPIRPPSFPSKKREASKGKWSVGLAAASLVLFIAAVVLALFFDGKLGGLIGGTGLFAMLLSAYGFTLGLSSFFRWKHH